VGLDNHTRSDYFCSLNKYSTKEVINNSRLARKIRSERRGEKTSTKTRVVASTGLRAGIMDQLFQGRGKVEEVYYNYNNF